MGEGGAGHAREGIRQETERRHETRELVAERRVQAGASLIHEVEVAILMAKRQCILA